MKKFLCLFTVVCMLLLAGCSGGANTDSTAVFYYCRSEYSYGSAEGVIAPEVRDITGHEGDMQYLLSMYLMGPMSEELESPFPSRTKILSVRYGEDCVILEITDCEKLLSDSQFTLACGCLAMTSLGLTDNSQVMIKSGSQSMTLTAESFLLYDSVTPVETTLPEDVQ